MSDLSYEQATDQEVLEELGTRLRSIRKITGLNQSEAASRAGLSRDTLSRAENGDNPTLQTLIRLLRVYGRLNALEHFVPEPELSPMARLRERRARHGDYAEHTPQAGASESEEA